VLLLESFTALTTALANVAERHILGSLFEFSRLSMQNTRAEKKGTRRAFNIITYPYTYQPDESQRPERGPDSEQQKGISKMSGRH
jgi:hypothetical protein